MLKLSCAGFLGLSSGILSQFTFEMCAAAENFKNVLKTHFWGFEVVQSHRCCLFIDIGLPCPYSLKLRNK